MTEKAKVAIVDVGAGIREALEEAIKLTGGLAIKPGDKVVIKPNLSDMRTAEDGVTTDPRLVEALVQIIRTQIDADITIVESDHWVAEADDEFDSLGYRDLAEQLGVKLVNLSRDEKIEITLNGHYFKNFSVARTLLESDYFISVANLKTHTNEKITCILKNQFGLIPERYKSKHHPYMSNVLTDLNKLFKPDLCIVDGTVAMEGKGPTLGNPKKMNCIICGKDPVAVDSVAARIMGFNPSKIPHLKYAAKHGVGTKAATIMGMPLDKVKSNFEFIPFSAYYAFRLSFWAMRLGNRLQGLMKRGANSFVEFGSYRLKYTSRRTIYHAIKRILRSLKRKIKS